MLKVRAHRSPPMASLCVAIASFPPAFLLFVVAAAVSYYYYYCLAVPIAAAAICSLCCGASTLCSRALLSAGRGSRCRWSRKLIPGGQLFGLAGNAEQ